MRFCLCVLLLASVAVADEPKPILPAELKTSVGKLEKITADTAAKKVFWKVQSPLQFLPCCDKSINVVGLLPGRYSIAAYVAVAADDVQFSECVLIVEGAAPLPPIPPAPVPPLPPVPDQLETDIRSLFAADTAPDRVATIGKLASLYKVAANSCQDLQIDTAGRLAQVIRDASTTLVGSGLIPLRRRVGEELGRVLPTDPDAKLTPELRDRAAKLFLRLNQICEGIK